AGIHLVIATQRPSVNVITGVIKANIPSRIAFAVSSQIDSRTILDTGGAEKLLGRGDMLYAPQGAGKPTRVQGCFVSDDEVQRIVDYVRGRHDADYNEDVIEQMNTAAEEDKSEKSDAPAGGEAVDEMLSKAIDLAVEAGQVSISMLQRRLRVGYARAGRLVDEMTLRGITGEAEGPTKPRAVLISREEWRRMQENQQ
ncbi:MAG: DNA translocase FtsK, partial [Candidatus Ventricola sp.]